MRKDAYTGSMIIIESSKHFCAVSRATLKLAINASVTNRAYNIHINLRL